MLGWIIQISIISFIFIFLIHHLISFFTLTLTVPKVKDLVNSPSKKYQDIYNVLSSNNQDIYTSIDLLPSESNSSMKDELKSFLKKQLKSENDSNVNQNQSTSLDFLPTNYDDQQYTQF